MGGTTGTIDNESRLSSELSRGEVEKWDVDGSCMGWYPYVNGHVDMDGNSGSLGSRGIAEVERGLMGAATTRAGLRTIPGMSRVDGTTLVAMASTSTVVARA